MNCKPGDLAVVAMAKEAEISFETMVLLCGVEIQVTASPLSVDEMARFAALVAAKAAADEREACAALCDRFAARTTEAQQGPSDTLSNVMLRQVAVLGFGEAAHAIRARGVQP